MLKKIVLVHTLKPLVGVFQQLCNEMLEGVDVLHILDEPLLELVRMGGELVPIGVDRLLSHTQEAQQVGAELVLVTCSTISPYVDLVQERLNIPVIKIDEAMIAQAISMANHIGVVATNATTLQPTQYLLDTKAMEEGKSIETELVLVEKALPALLLGDENLHDELVKQAVLDLSKRVEVIILAQASMARVLPTIAPHEISIPVLTSPHQALKMVQKILSTSKQWSNQR